MYNLDEKLIYIIACSNHPLGTIFCKINKFNLMFKLYAREGMIRGTKTPQNILPSLNTLK
jgi:hypothetical protein